MGELPDVEALVLRGLTDEERRSAVVYLDDRVIEPPEVVTIDGEEIEVSSPSILAFVDQDPGANWGHASRYVIVDTERGEARSFPAQMPPFLRGVPATLRVIYRAEGVPDWAVT